MIIGGEPQEDTYADFQDEMDVINKAFIEVLREGDGDGRPFTFPIPTYNTTSDFNWNDENAELLFDMTARYGSPYYSNFIGNKEMDPSDVRSMCCRLRLRTKELEKNVTSGLFGSGNQTGSLSVVTINLPRIAYNARDEDWFFQRLAYLMRLASKSLQVKREVVEKNIQSNLLPYSKRYLGTLRNHFNTIGLIGERGVREPPWDGDLES